MVYRSVLVFADDRHPICKLASSRVRSKIKFCILNTLSGGQSTRIKETYQFSDIVFMQH